MRLHFIAAVLIAAAAGAAAQVPQDLFTPGPFNWNVAPPGSYCLAYTSDSEVPRLSMTYNSVRNEYLLVFPARPNQHYYFLPGASGIYAQRIDAATGARVGELLAVHTSSDQQAWMDVPSVVHAPDADRYMIAFRDDWYGHLLGVILQGDGARVSESPFSLDDNESEEQWPDSIGLTYDAARSTFVAAWDIDESFGSGLFCRRYGVDGAPRSPILQVEAWLWNPPAPGMLSLSYLAGADKTLIVYASDAWTWSEVPKAPTISARVLGTDDSISAPVTLSAPADFARWKTWPRVAANSMDREWMVAWEETDIDPYAGKAGTIGDIAFRRVTAAGLPAGPGPVTLEGGPEADYAPAVAWNSLEDQYVLTWQRGAYGPAADILSRSIPGASDAPTLATRVLAGDSAAGETAPCIAARSSASEVFVAWLVDDASIRGVRSNIAIGPPSAPAHLAQARSDGATALPPGASVRDGAFVASATISQPEGNALKLQVEVQPGGVAFTGVPTATSGAFVASGSAPAIRIDALSGDRGWHWQCRAIDPAGRTSSWIPFASNPVPGQADFLTWDNRLPSASAPSAYNPIGGSAIAQASGIGFRATVDDPDGDHVRLEIEVQPEGSAFTGVPDAFSSYVPSGGVADVRARPAAGPQHWRYRAVDDIGGAGPWIDPLSAFLVTATGSGGPASCLNGARGPGTLPWATAALALAVLRLRR